MENYTVVPSQGFYMNSSVLELFPIELFRSNLTSENSYYSHFLQNASREDFVRQNRLPTNKIKTTRYTPLTFVPKNLIEQFHRFANVYFVFIAILNFVPQVEAINPWMALVPPLFIFMVTAAKDGREYYTRAKLDDKINNQKVRVYQDGCFIHRKWESVRVGDIVELDLNDVIPGPGYNTSYQVSRA